MSQAAILIDGGYFLKRLPSLRRDVDMSSPESVDRCIGQLIWNHLQKLNEISCHENALAGLYRSFFYDARPYAHKGHLPVSRRAIDYSRTREATFRQDLFKLLRKRPNFAVRLGDVKRERAWIMREDAQRSLLDGDRQAQQLTDEDFVPGFRQKAVDMRMGIDIASLTLKKLVGTIVLVAGDADFVPAAKLAQREGVRVVLDPLWQNVSDELFEHIDGLWSGFPRPGNRRA
ncbi:MAG: NYN domain-containing protein [Alphaproteobacteria bacterium]|nr:MAG: NYN domain-containing protein [Alphaproteobacteria bacterium]